MEWGLTRWEGQLVEKKKKKTALRPSNGLEPPDPNSQNSELQLAHHGNGAEALLDRVDEEWRGP